MLQIFLHVYYGSKESNRIDCLKIELVRIPSWDEVQDVVFTIGGFKALDPNGMPTLFYKTYQGIVGDDLVAIAHECFLIALMSSSTNAK